MPRTVAELRARKRELQEYGRSLRVGSPEETRAHAEFTQVIDELRETEIRARAAIAAAGWNRAWDVFLHHRFSGRTGLISVAINGKAGNGPSYGVAITPSRRFVLFNSWARNLTRDSDWACCETDVFVRDRRLGTTRRASNLPGVQPMWGVAISADGRYVLMETNTSRIYLHDMARNGTTLIGRGVPLGLSPDGRFLAYCRHCFASDSAVRIRDRVASRTRRVPLASSWITFRPVLFSADGRFVFFDGYGPNGFSVLRWRQGAPHVTDLTPGLNANLTSITPDGSIVAFVSESAGIVPGDTNGATDLFRKVIATGDVRRLDISSTGNRIQHGVSPTPLTAFISANGHWATWASKGSDIVANDTNTVWRYIRARADSIAPSTQKYPNLPI